MPRRYLASPRCYRRNSPRGREPSLLLRWDSRCHHRSVPPRWSPRRHHPPTTRRRSRRRLRSNHRPSRRHGPPRQGTLRCNRPKRSRCHRFDGLRRYTPAWSSVHSLPGRCMPTNRTSCRCHTRAIARHSCHNRGAARRCRLGSSMCRRCSDRCRPSCRDCRSSKKCRACIPPHLRTRTTPTTLHFRTRAIGSHNCRKTAWATRRKAGRCTRTMRSFRRKSAFHPGRRPRSSSGCIRLELHTPTSPTKPHRNRCVAACRRCHMPLPQDRRTPRRCTRSIRNFRRRCGCRRRCRPRRRSVDTRLRSRKATSLTTPPPHSCASESRSCRRRERRGRHNAGRSTVPIRSFPHNRGRRRRHKPRWSLARKQAGPRIRRRMTMSRSRTNGFEFRTRRKLARSVHCRRSLRPEAEPVARWVRSPETTVRKPGWQESCSGKPC
jgi:hypothetical protein